MIRITKIESVLGDFGIHYYRKRTEETAAAIKAISAAVGERIFGDILTAIDGAESEAFKDGIELGRVYAGYSLASSSLQHVLTRLYGGIFKAAISLCSSFVR